VKAHPWFKEINWEKLKAKKLVPPFTPVYRPEDYQEQFAAIPDVPVPPDTLLLLRKEAIQSRCLGIQMCLWTTFIMGRMLSILLSNMLFIDSL
jgi:hypothetical protein